MIPLMEKKKPKRCANTPGLSGEANEGLPNHPDPSTASYGRCGSVVLHKGSAQPNTLQPFIGGAYRGLLAHEGRLCSGVPPLPVRSVGRGLPALAFASWSVESLLICTRPATTR